MSTYKKICALFDTLVNGDCSKKSTRTLLPQLMMTIDMYEKERSANTLQELFKEACSEFQWFYWTAEEYYGGVGDWREFPPMCVSKLNQAVNEGKSSVQVTLSQHEYMVDFTDMTKRLIAENLAAQHTQYSQPIFVQVKLREDFTTDKFIQVLKRMNTEREFYVSILHGILKILKSSAVQPLDAELTTNSLTLLLRLLTYEGMVDEFTKADGISIVMQVCCGEDDMAKGSVTYALANTLVALILRRCIDSDQAALRDVYEQTVKNTCNGSPVCLIETTSRRHALRARRYQKDPKRVFRLLSPLATMSPEIFLDTINNSLVIKKNELQLKEQQSVNESREENANLKTVLQRVIEDLPFGDQTAGPARASRLLQPANLLKFVAELLRSYSAASQIFVELTSDGQPILKRMIDKFLLSSSELDDALDVAISTKTVICGLISNKATSKMTDQIVEDIRALLYSITEEHSKTQCSAAENNEVKAKSATKYAERLTVLIRLSILLRDTFFQINVPIPSSTKQSPAILIKSFHTKNLLNEFVRAIWILPLHERQGIDTVNTLLKLFEGLVGRDMMALGLAAGNQDQAGATQQQNAAPDANDAETAGTSSLTTGSSTSQGGQQDVPRDVDSLHNLDENPATEESLHMNEADVSHEHDEEEESHQDDSSTQTDEDMETAEDLDEMRAVAAEVEDMVDDRASEQMPDEGDDHADHHHHHQNLPVDDVADEMEDDDDDDDEEEDDEEDDGEREENDETLVEFENVLADYMDMTNFANITNEVNMIRQNINRINMNLTNLTAARHMQHAFVQNIPRNIRSLLTNHPRGAMLRIRDRHGGNRFTHQQNIHIPVHIGIHHHDGGFVMQAGQWPPGIVGSEPVDELNIGRSIPHFVDRQADLFGIIQPQAIFQIGTILSSYLMTTIKVAKPSEEKKKEADEKKVAEEDKKDAAPVEEGQAETAANTMEETQPQQSIEGIQSEVPIPRQQLAEAEQHRDGQQPTTDEGQTAVAEGTSQPMNSSTTSTDAPQPVVGENQAANNPEATPSVQQPPAPDATGQQPAQVPEGVDPAFLAALPEEMRQEVIRDHLIQQQLNTAAAQPAAEQNLPPEQLAAVMGMEVPEGMDPAFLAALPEDIFQEVVRDHQRQQEQARQRQAAHAQAARRRHLTHRQFAMPHFAMPHFFGGGRIARAAAAFPDGQMPANLSNTNSIQLLDRESICTLLLIYFLDQNKFNIARLQKLLRNICIHPGSCDFIVWALLSILDGLEKFDTTENVDPEIVRAQLGWINNLRLGASLDRNERILQVTPKSVFINQQVRLSAANNVVDTLGYLAQRFANHFMPKAIRNANGKFEQPPTIVHFWNIIRGMNNEVLEDALRSAKTTTLPETAVDSLEKSPFAYILKFVDSNLVIKNQGLMEKIIRTALMLSQGLAPDLHEKTPPETKQWIGTRVAQLVNILHEECSDVGLRDGRALIAQLLGLFPSERHHIMSALHETIIKNADQLRGDLKEVKVEFDKELAKAETQSSEKGAIE